MNKNKTKGKLFFTDASRPYTKGLYPGTCKKMSSKI